jgi:Tol biopolymer transport system component
MKQLLLMLAACCLFISCKKSKSDIIATSGQPKIYYQGSNASSFGWEEIFSMNEDGTGEQQITNFSKDGSLQISTQDPVLSPDGKKIFFVSHKDFSGGEIFSMNPDGSGVTKIISNNIQGSSMQAPVIFPDGQKMAYFIEVDSMMDRHGEIFTANIDGSNKKSLISYPADGNCYHPCVNPVNNSIVYTNLVNNKMELYSMNMDGTNKQQLTSTGPTVKLHPQFSPDGTKIVFDAITGIGTEIFIMDTNGSNMKQLTTYSNNGTKNTISWGATFSKDGNTIYFSSDEFNGRTGQLYKMNADGSNKLRLTSSAVDKFNPCVK